MKTILWFRRDLRVEDNILLTCEVPFGHKGAVLPIFIFDENILCKLPRDDRRVNFIYEAVCKLKADLQEKGFDLAIFYGKPVKIIRAILEKTSIDKVVACGDYDGYARQRDIEVSRLVEFESLHGTYIFKPDEILKDDGSPYRVFTPFYKKAKTVFSPLHLAKSEFATGLSLLPFEYNTPSLDSLGFISNSYGVEEIDTLLEKFALHVSDYQTKRDFIDTTFTSALSVHLRFGTLGIKQLLRWLLQRKKEGIDTEPFFRQLVFREFYASLLYHFSSLAERNFNYSFNGIEDEEKFAFFCSAKTGVPIVDAGVQELLQTGKMHNRVRMIIASFFTKDLLLPWQWGEKFFALHLLDYDAASNILSWQWSAGTGVDPQPYFRVFNPYLQAKKFDKEARYIKKWLPQLLHVSPSHLYNEEKLLHGSIANYPKPCVVHTEAARKAIDAFRC